MIVYQIYYSPDEALGQMQETLEQAEIAVEEGDEDTALRLIAKLRADVDDLAAQVGEVKGQMKDFAPGEHGHELPESLQQLARDLQELEAEEVGPNHQHKRYRKLFGG